MIVARILEPASKLATARGLAEATAVNTLGEILDAGLGEDDLYGAMDWLLERQDRIERGLARRHLGEGCLVLYDLTSVWMEGRTCPLARRGHSRDGKKGKLQIEFGLLCNRDGCPVSVEVFAGNTADPATVGSQVAALRQRFNLSKVVLVGDRGMLTEARIREDVKPAGLDWISALRGPAIRSLVEAGDIGMSLFDERDLVEITSDAYPGERLMVCRNPLLAEDRARKRAELLEATEALLEPITSATRRDTRRLTGAARIGERVGKVIGKYKMAKHFTWSIDDGGVLTFRRNDAAIAAEARLDGLYVIRTSLPQDEIDGPGTVRAYKRLSSVERAFRSLKTVDLKVRPVHSTAPKPRVRAHVLLCMLAYHVEWHMRQRLKPLLFDDDDAEGTEALRPSVVAPAKVPPGARAKAGTKRTPDGECAGPAVVGGLGACTAFPKRGFPAMKASGSQFCQRVQESFIRVQSRFDWRLGRTHLQEFAEADGGRRLEESAAAPDFHGGVAHCRKFVVCDREGFTPLLLEPFGDFVPAPQPVSTAWVGNWFREISGTAHSAHKKANAFARPADAGRYVRQGSQSGVRDTDDLDALQRLQVIYG